MLPWSLIDTATIPGDGGEIPLQRPCEARGKRRGEDS